MKISRYEEPDQAHKMIVAAVDFISDHVNQVWTSLNVAIQGRCGVFCGVTLNYEGQSLVPSLNPSIASLQHTLYYSPIIHSINIYRAPTMSEGLRLGLGI